jgi:hypothetical protein
MTSHVKRQMLRRLRLVCEEMYDLRVFCIRLLHQTNHIRLRAGLGFGSKSSRNIGFKRGCINISAKNLVSGIGLVQMNICARELNPACLFLCAAST